MSRWLRVAVPVLSLALAAASVVAGLWWRRTHAGTVSEVITRPAPELGPRAHLLLPGLRDAVVVVPDRPHDPAEVRSADRLERIQRTRSFRVSTNAQGFRGPPLADSAAGRVVCLGDSVTFGWGLPEPRSYPRQLAGLLGVDVVNAGVPAMKPGSIAAWAQQHLAALRPSLVLFARRPDHMLPDPWGDYQRAVRMVEQVARPAPVGVILPPVGTFDPKAAQEWPAESARVRELVAPTPVLELTTVFREALPRPGVILEQEAGRQRVVRLPDRSLVLDVAAPEHGLADEIVALFEDDAQVSEPLFFDGGHPDAEGMTLFAHAVADWITAQGWLGLR